MSVEALSERSGRRLISACLAAIAATAESCLEAQEATERARHLLALILGGTLSPAKTPVDGHQKDVLYALVYHVLPLQPDETGTRETVAAFIREMPWGDDPAGEKQELASDCAARRAIADGSQSIEEVDGEAPDDPLPFARLILIQGHGLTDAEAQRLEREISDWFTRFRERPGVASRGRAAMIEACQRAMQERSDSEGSGNAKLDRLLRFALAEIGRQRKSR